MEIITRKDAMAKGLKRYFTGKPCKRGHIVERTVSGGCVLCKKERNRNYRQCNLEKQREYDRKVYYKNRRKKAERSRGYYHCNLEDSRARSRKWHNENRESIKEARRKSVYELHDSYIKAKIHKQTGIPHNQQTPEMIELKRENIKITRLIGEVRRENNQ